MKWTRCLVVISQLPKLKVGGSWRGKTVYYLQNCLSLVKVLPPQWVPQVGDQAIFMESGCRQDKLQFTLLKPHREHPSPAYGLWVVAFNPVSYVPELPPILIPPKGWRGRVWRSVGKRKGNVIATFLVVGGSGWFQYVDPSGGEEKIMLEVKK